ncbi:MAG: Hpt domain-containing protein [Magnetococcales bacterium]|nr:Hpt domain-containing protein [Magnetococcales bacterium]
MNTTNLYQELIELHKLTEMHEELEGGFFTVVRHYQAGIVHRPERIRQALREQDPERVAMESHSLKSVCRQVGLQNMGNLAAQLEAMSATGSLQDVEPLVEQLIASSVVASQELTRYCHDMGASRPFQDKEGVNEP